MAKRRKENIEKYIPKKKKNKVKKFFRALLFWFVILIAFSGVGFGCYYIYTSDDLKVKMIKVENSKYYTSEKVLEVADVPNNKNMLFIGKGKIKERILEELPYIEDVKIKIGKESTLRIIVTERTSKYVINNKDTNEYVKVDKYGIMLEKVKAEDILPNEMPLFRS